jgi:hypothetical protein
MDWLTGNWIWLVLIAACVGMHFFGHGGHSAGGGARPKERGSEDRGSGAASGHHH